MVALLAAREVSKTHASRPLFSGLSIAFHPGEHVGVIGPNGSGKTTLLRILAGIELPDSGTVERSNDVRIAYLPQIDVFPSGTVEGALIDAARSPGLEEYEPIVRARKMLRRLGFESGDRSIEALSGGWRKRLAIGCALVGDPNLLLLDEPTNHLDLAGVEWLERFLARSSLSFIVISHDRYFLERAANRIVEIDPRYPHGFLSVSGRYSDFLEKRGAFLAVQEAERQALANDVRREIEWLRRGPKARSTKAGYRIQEAHRKIGEISAVRERRARVPDLAIDFPASGRRTHDLIVAQAIEKRYGGRWLFRGLDAHVHPGTRLGIVGNNASGKTTLLRTLAGSVPPDRGEVRRAPGLRIAVFDPQRERLVEGESLRRALSPSGDTVSYLGRGTHIIAWAKRFGFRPDQLDLAVGDLSGGEQARVRMARMMREPADLLMLDEPTNDLDISSIEVLERALADFPGAVLLITHDRHLLDRVCTDLIGLHGDGRWGAYASVAHWMDADSVGAASNDALDRSTGDRAERSTASAALSRRGLTYHEKREFAGLEEEVFAAEAAVDALRARLEDPELAADHERLHAAYEAHRAAQAELDRRLARWEELERKRLGE